MFQPPPLLPHLLFGKNSASVKWFLLILNNYKICRLIFLPKLDISSGCKGLHSVVLLHSGLSGNDHHDHDDDHDGGGDVVQCWVGGAYSIFLTKCIERDEKSFDNDDDKLTKRLKLARYGKSFLSLICCPAVKVECR